MSLWEKLGEYLCTKGHDENDFLSLLKFIDAVDNPIELPRILDNLLQIIPRLNSTVNLYSGFDLGLPLPKWRDICQELKSAPALQEMLVATNKQGKMPLLGYYEDNPVYVAIWQRPGSPSDQLTYFQLIAYCLFAVAILRDRTEKQILHNVSKQALDNFKGTINRSLLAVRNLALQKNLIILESLPDLNVTPDALLEILDKASKELDPIKVLLKYLLDIRKPPHRQEHINPHQQTDPPACVSIIATNLDPEQEEGTTTFNLFQLPVINKAKEKEIESVGCSPAEGYSGVEIILPRMNTANYKQITSPDQKGLKKRKIKTQLAMLNQKLTSRWEVLSVYEISAFLTAVADLIEKKESSKYLPDNSTYGELTALLTTLFWFGQRLDKIDKLRIYNHAPGSRDTEPGFVTITEQYCYWWTKPATPARKILPDDLQQEQAYPTVANFALFSGIGIEQIISDYIINFRHGRSQQLFPHEKSVYEKMVSSFISAVNSRHATRLTANRLSDCLFDLISHQDGADLTVAMFIIGRENFLGRNPSYYTSISVTELQALYKRVCNVVRGQHYNEHHRDNDADLAGCGKETGQAMHVGSPFRPTPGTVKNLVTELKTSLINALQADTSVLKLMRIHNSMTRYTAFLIAFSTGFRAIRDPFLSAAEIDWNSGFAVLSDKDNEDGYNSRLIWLPPVCLQQLEFFREHQQNALYRFSILMPDIFSMLDRLRRDAPGRHMFFTNTNEAKDGYQAMTLGPMLLGRRLRSVYALPFNASRHHLRSCLLERKCPVEVINAFMGHFERGEEPWGIYSGFSPHTYRDALMDKLVPLLSEAGWEALPGLKVQL